MAEQKAWTVTFAAKRKVTRREQCDVTMNITEADLRKFLSEPTASIDAIDPDDLRDALEEIASERCETADIEWNCTELEDDGVDIRDFEIRETP